MTEELIDGLVHAAPIGATQTLCGRPADPWDGEDVDPTPEDGDACLVCKEIVETVYGRPWGS